MPYKLKKDDDGGLVMGEGGFPLAIGPNDEEFELDPGATAQELADLRAALHKANGEAAQRRLALKEWDKVVAAVEAEGPEPAKVLERIEAIRSEAPSASYATKAKELAAEMVAKVEAERDEATENAQRYREASESAHGELEDLVTRQHLESEYDRLAGSVLRKGSKSAFVTLSMMPTEDGHRWRSSKEGGRWETHLVDANGEIRYGPDAVKPMSSRDFVTTYIAKQHDFLLQPKDDGVNGSPAGARSKPLYKMPDDELEKLADERING